VNVKNNNRGVIESRDPWVTRVLVVAGRGKAEHLEAYDEMQLLYNTSNDFEEVSLVPTLEHEFQQNKVMKS